MAIIGNFSHAMPNLNPKMQVIRRASIIFAILLLLPAISPSLAGPRAGAYAAGPATETDFNGDGYADIAVGAPSDSVNGKAGAGVVNVVYGSSQGIIATAALDGSGRDDQRFFQDAAGIEGVSKADDKLGTDVAAGDFNGDGYSDLAMGAPGDDYGAPNTGSVNVVYGSSSGLSASAVLPDQIWTGASPGLNEIHNTCSDDFDQPIETFGQVLASGDFNGDGFDDLAVGAPGDRLCLSGIGSVGEFWTAGSLHIIYGSSSGLAITASRDNQFDQGGNAIGITYLSVLEAGDFNNDGYDDLAAADPVEFCCSGAAGDSGGYALVYHGGAGGFVEGVDGEMMASQTWDQDSAGIEDIKEGGDRFGDSLAAGDFNSDGYDDLAIGVSGESGSVPGSAFAGAASIIYGSPTGLSATFVPDQFFTQDTPNVEGSVEEGDGFGSSLAAGDFNGDGKDDLAIGVAGEDVGATVDAGSSNIIYGSSSGLSATAVLPDRVLDQNSANVEGSSEASDDYSSFGTGGFGASMTSADYNNDGKDDLAIGVPGEDVGAVVDAGSSNIIYGSSSGISATAALADRVLDQNSANVEDSSETGDGFGFSLA